MAAIFLSYSRDDRPYAETLARVLEGAGHEVWWDRRIDSGDEFATEIEAALDKADIVLVAWSLHAGKSAWVRDEAAAGRDTGRLLPISIDGSSAPMGFRQFQVLDLNGWKGGKRDRRTAELFRSIDRRLEGKQRVPVGHEERPASSAKVSRKLWIAGATSVLVTGVAVALFIVRSNEAAAEPTSLAVLPFKNLSAGEPYFAEGVAEEIADQLSREPQIKVAGRTSSDLFKNAADLQDVGRRLHVAYVLEGSVRSVGSRVRVDVALVDTRKGMRLWNEDFRGRLDDIFGIQERIGQQVAEHLNKTLIRQSPVAGSTTSRGDVYNLYVTARSLMKLREPGKIAAAIDLLKQAVRLDPNYAPAWAQLALATQLGQFYGHESDFNSEVPQQEQLAYAQRAIALAPRLGEAHAIYGMILQSGTLDAVRLRRGRQELEAAVRLDPNDPLAWYWLSEQRLIDLDFEGALDAIKRTATIDPFFVFSEKYAVEAWWLGDQPDAVRFLNDRITNHPEPFVREMARELLARLNNDVSAAYKHAKVASEIGSTDQKPIAQSDMGGFLLQLGLFDQAEQFIPHEIVSTFRGTTAPKGGQGPDFWLRDDQAPRLYPRLWVKNGQSQQLVDLFDRVFSSPDDMAARYSHLEFVEFAPLMAIGLQRAGRHNDGVRFLLLGDQMCAEAIRRGRTPQDFRVRCSKIWALMGRREQAIQTLQQAVAQGWRPLIGEFSKVTDEPAYIPIRNDPRLQSINSLILDYVARERRELMSAGT